MTFRTESVYYTPSADGTYCLGVQRNTSSAGTLPSWIQVQSYIGPSLKHSTTSHGITNPSETKNPGAFAGGAAHWNDTVTIYIYSSLGPLPDGSIKPYIVGAHFVANSTLTKTAHPAPASTSSHAARPCRACQTGRLIEKSVRHCQLPEGQRTGARYGPQQHLGLRVRAVA